MNNTELFEEDCVIVEQDKNITDCFLKTIGYIFT